MNLHCHAMTEPGSTGGTLRAWFVPSTELGEQHRGTLVGTYQSAGDAAPTDPFTFKWWDGLGYVPLDVMDDVFGLSYAFEAQARYNLVVMYIQEDDPSNWYSSDDGRTWVRVGPAPIYGIITNALDPVTDNTGNRLTTVPAY